MAFRVELEELAKKNKNLNLIYIINQPTEKWKGAIGNIDAEMVKQQLPDYQENVFFTCGPPPMVEAMEKLVISLGLPKEKLKRELFSGY
jgi:ferredoxin-NADP reductase